MQILRQILFSAISALLMFSTAYAGKWRINNTGLQANFTTIQAAHDAITVLAGDTLYLESSVVGYGTLSSTKKLVIIGPGNFLGENDSTQYNLAPAMISATFFMAGSEGTIVTGVYFVGYVYVNANNILFKRTRISSLDFSNNASNCVFTQGYVDLRMYVYDGSSNIQISNSIFAHSAAYDASLTMYPSTSGTITNNIFNTNHSVANATYRNNISTGAPGTFRDSFTTTNSSISNNIGAGTQYPTGNGNQQNIDMTTVFTYTGSSDGLWKLKAGSPAIGAGYGGVDCGVFGGSAPYVLSMLPTLPAIWLIDINGLNVTVKAKSH
jgi:hypothetical protein